MLSILWRLSNLVYPPKCILCEKLLVGDETDLCRRCRTETPEFPWTKNHLSFVAGWTAVWYYSGNVRKSILRYKFAGRRVHAAAYGRLLAMRLLEALPYTPDAVTWVPVSFQRHNSRGFDQVELIARTVSQELHLPLRRILKKVRNTPAQSSLTSVAARKANVLGAFRIRKGQQVAGQRILLLDDVLTTGATASECGRVLLTGGAKEVYCGVLAATARDDPKYSHKCR